MKQILRHHGRQEGALEFRWANYAGPQVTSYNYPDCRKPSLDYYCAFG